MIEVFYMGFNMYYDTRSGTWSCFIEPLSTIFNVETELVKQSSPSYNPLELVQATLDIINSRYTMTWQIVKS